MATIVPPPPPTPRPLPPGPEPERLGLDLPDGYRTPVWALRPDPAAPRRLPVLYVHGIQSHPHWFLGSAAALARAGHAVYLVTRRGSGIASQDRGHAPSAEALLNDVAAAAGFVRRETGSDRLHLLGVSWGGKLLAAYTGRAGGASAAASLTMVAPGVAARVDVPWWTKLAVAACLLASPRKLFTVPLSDVELFTDNEEMRRYLRQDRYRLHRATAAFLYASRRLDVLLRGAPDGAIAVPTTLLLATRDRIIDNAAASRIVRRLTAGRAVVRELEGCHTLEFEPNPEPFHRELVASLARAD